MPISWGGLGGQLGGIYMAVPWVPSGLYQWWFETHGYRSMTFALRDSLVMFSRSCRPGAERSRSSRWFCSTETPIFGEEPTEVEGPDCSPIPVGYPRFSGSYLQSLATSLGRSKRGSRSPEAGFIFVGWHEVRARDHGLHWGGFGGQCRHTWHTWSAWDNYNSSGSLGGTRLWCMTIIPRPWFGILLDPPPLVHQSFALKRGMLIVQGFLSFWCPF